MINKDTHKTALINFDLVEYWKQKDNLGSESFTERINRLVKEDNERHNYLSKHN